MINETYTIEKDKEFQRTILYDMNIAKKTKDTYKKTIKNFIDVIDKPFFEIVSEIKAQQNDKIVGNTILKYNPNESLCNDYITKYLNHCRERGNKESTLSIREKHIRTILHKSGIILPEIKIKHKKSHEKKNILTRSDIQYVISKSNLHHKALISFACSTGFRVGDLVKFTVEDFMEATRDYHDYYDVEEFIEKAPYDMMGFWRITPQKTKNIDLECRVCNSTESSNYILDSLTERKDFLNSQGLTVDLDDALFASRNGKYKKHYSETSLSPLFSNKNKILEEYKKKQITKEYKTSRISRRDYKNRINNIPKFHAHACRHFFITTIRAYTTNRDVSLIMEGHTSPYKMDKHYVGLNEELFSDDIIKETYSNIMDYLIFSKEVDPQKYLELKEVEGKYRKSVEKTKELERKYNEMNELLKEIISNHRDSRWDDLE